VKVDLAETRVENMDSIHLAEDGGKWQAVVNTVINHQVL
jgi:hypothetical protein